ncbi:MAG: TIR domain-containing protein [Candidatus Binatia bacterium]
MTTPRPDPVDLFYSYSLTPQDQSLYLQLEAHLSLLRRKGVIREWRRQDVRHHQAASAPAQDYLTLADIILLLISADYLQSEYCYNQEMTRALERHEAGEARVIPIILRACDLTDAPFQKLQALPTDGRPVTSWPNPDEAWTTVAIGIRKAIENLPEYIRERPRFSAPPPMVARGRESLQEKAVTTLMRGVEYLLRKLPPWRGGTLGFPPEEPSPAAPTPPARDTELLRLLIHRFQEQMELAYKKQMQTSPSQPEKDQLYERAMDLTAMTDQKSILWVDDLPDNNIQERAALAALQIYVRTAQTTEEAMQVLKEREERYDLVITDWTRHPQKYPDIPEGVRLLMDLRAEGSNMPIIFYHGAIGREEQELRTQALAQAAQVGVVGATSNPNELLQYIVTELQKSENVR